MSKPGYSPDIGGSYAIATAISPGTPSSVFTAVEVAAVPAAPPRRVFSINEAGARDYLGKLNWPYGLTDVVIEGLKKVPFRTFICDDSGSMNESDGSRLVVYHGKHSFVRSSRWAELTQSLTFHLGLAAAAGVQTEFRLLNAAQPIVVSPEHPEAPEVLRSIFQGSPSGGTPLCRHIREVIQEIKLIEPTLRANGQKACIIIATDGESSDGNIAEAMKPLEQLPVWVVIRLCTSDDKIVEYWNNIDNMIEVEIDVLDDFASEAEEIEEHNPWFTYGEPLHRVREFGIPMKALDLIDEKPLPGDSIRIVASIILGGVPDSYPNPEVDFKAFVQEVQAKQRNIPEVWDPLTKTLQPWIKKNELGKALKVQGECSMM